MGKFTEYKLPLKSLPEGTSTMTFHMGKPFFVNMENTDIHDANLDAELTVVNRNGLYDMTFDIKGEVIVLCDRCLDDLHFPIETSYHIVVKFGDRYNDDSDEYLEIPESDNYLNVAYMLYDTVALAIPIKHVHPLGKCNRQMSALLKKHRAEARDPEEMDLNGEIDIDDVADAPDSSQSQSVDPRWEKLRELKDKSSE